MRLNFGKLAFWGWGARCRTRRIARWYLRYSRVMDHLDAALAKGKSGDLEGQIAEIKTAITLEPGGGGVLWLTLSSAFEAKCDYDASAAVLQALLDEWQRKDTPRRQLARLLTRPAFWRMRREFEAMVRWKRGRALASAGRAEGAAAEWRRVITLDPKGRWAEHARLVMKENGFQRE